MLVVIFHRERRRPTSLSQWYRSQLLSISSAHVCTSLLLEVFRGAFSFGSAGYDYSLVYKLLRITFDVIDIGGAAVFMLVLFRINIRPVWYSVPAGKADRSLSFSLTLTHSHSFSLSLSLSHSLSLTNSLSFSRPPVSLHRFLSFSLPFPSLSFCFFA